MKAFYLVAVVVGAVSVAVAQVSPGEHAAHHPDQAAAANSATPSKKAPASSSATPSAKSAPADAAVADMKGRMKSMQDLMEKLSQSKDPAERAKLLAQHRKAMHEQLASMQRMDCGMMGGDAGKTASADHPGMTDKGTAGKDGGGMMGQGMMSGGMMKCHEMMETRIDMMVGMMDQMMRHEEAQGAPQ